MGWIGFRTLHGFHHHIQLEALHTVGPYDFVQWDPVPLPTNLLAAQELPSTAGRQTSRQAWPGGSAAMESWRTVLAVSVTLAGRSRRRQTVINHMLGRLR